MNDELKALAEAHARGIREGAELAAGVCEALAAQWETGEQDRPYLRGMIDGAGVCAVAILQRAGTGKPDEGKPS